PARERHALRHSRAGDGSRAHLRGQRRAAHHTRRALPGYLDRRCSRARRSLDMSMSNRARRMAEHHLRHRADVELNLIPLIDILSVMVAFLLVYSTEVEVIQNS